MEQLLERSIFNALLVQKKLSEQKKQVSKFSKSLVNTMLNLLLDGQLQQATASRCKHKLEESLEKLGNNKKKKALLGVLYKILQKNAIKKSKRQAQTN